VVGDGLMAWLIDQELEPGSTLPGLHHWGNHGACSFSPIGFLYHLQPDVQCLLGLQAVSVAITVLPIGTLARRHDLPRQTVLVPVRQVVVATGDFAHQFLRRPSRTLAMPLLSGSFLLRQRWTMGDLAGGAMIKYGILLQTKPSGIQSCSLSPSQPWTEPRRDPEIQRPLGQCGGG
jgi:hypothetical protein